MTISLKAALRDRHPVATEENLETGEIWMYTSGTSSANLFSGFCWQAKATGTAIIESWGAGGPGSRMCCCGWGLPGNSGAYNRKTISVVSGCYVCGCIGNPPCSSSLCFQGCGDPTMLCWFGSGTSGCMCAEGGRGGTSFCSTGTSMWCCYGGNGFCTTRKNLSDYCGLICNHCAGGWLSNAYGGDINKAGLVSCVESRQCAGNCLCYNATHVPVPPGLFTCDGSWVVYMADSDGGDGPGHWSGNQYPSFISAMSSLSRAPKRGSHKYACWRSDKACGCYEMEGCSPVLPIGTGGLPPQPCGDVRDQGWRGGWGAVRIKFIAG